MEVDFSRCHKVAVDGRMLLREDDYIDNEYYVYNCLLFRILGLWEYQTSTKKFIYVCFISATIGIAISQHIYAIVVSDRKIKSIVDLMDTTIPVLAIGSCYYNLLSNGTIMKKILCRIQCDWDDLRDKPELVILKKYAGVSRFCTIFITVSFYLYSAFLIFPSLLSIFQYNFGFIGENELILTFHLQYFEKNPRRYYIGICLEYAIVVILIMIGIANYSMLIATIQHACALFKVIEWRVNDRFNEYPDKFHFVNDNTDLVEENDWLVGIIKFYNNAIEFVNLVKLFYETLCLLEAFLVVTIIIVDYFYIFQLLSLDLSKIERITNISYIIATLFVIYTCYYLGQKLIDHSSNVFIVFCQIPFYSISLKTQKMLLFLIMSSMRISNLSVMGVKEISHDLFASLMRSAFSFAMIFHKLE